MSRDDNSWDLNRREALGVLGSTTLAAVAGCLEEGGNGNNSSEQNSSDDDYEFNPGGNFTVDPEISIEETLEPGVNVTGENVDDTEVRIVYEQTGETVVLEDGEEFQPEMSGNYTAELHVIGEKGEVEVYKQDFEVFQPSPFLQIQNSNGETIIDTPEDAEHFDNLQIPYSQLEEQRQNRLQRSFERNESYPELLSAIENPEEAQELKEWANFFDQGELRNADTTKGAMSILSTFIRYWNGLGKQVNVPDLSDDVTFEPDEWMHEIHNIDNAVIAEEGINRVSNAETRAFSFEILEKEDNVDENAYFHTEPVENGVYNAILMLDQDSGQVVVGDTSYNRINEELQNSFENLRNDLGQVEEVVSFADVPLSSPLVGHAIEEMKEALTEYFTGEYTEEYGDHIGRRILRAEGADAEDYDSWSEVVDNYVDDFEDVMEYEDLEPELGPSTVFRSPGPVSLDDPMWDHENIGRTSYWSPLNWSGEEPELDWVSYEDAAVTTARMIRSASRSFKLGQVENRIGEDADIALDPEFMEYWTDRLVDPNNFYNNRTDDLDIEEFDVNAKTVDALAEEEGMYGVLLEDDQTRVVEVESEEELEQIWQGEYQPA